MFSRMQYVFAPAKGYLRVKTKYMRTPKWGKVYLTTTHPILSSVNGHWSDDCGRSFMVRYSTLYLYIRAPPHFRLHSKIVLQLQNRSISDSTAHPVWNSQPILKMAYFQVSMRYPHRLQIVNYLHYLGDTVLENSLIIARREGSFSYSVKKTEKISTLSELCK